MFPIFSFFFLYLLYIDTILLFIITKLMVGLAMQFFDLHTYDLFFDYFKIKFYGICQLNLVIELSIDYFFV